MTVAARSIDRAADQRELTLAPTVIVGVMAALMTFAKQLGFLLIEDNRYFLQWRYVDSLAVLTDIVLLAALFVAVSLVARRWSLAERTWNRVLLLVLTSGVVSVFPPRFLPPMSIMAYRVWIAAIVASIVTLFWRRVPLVKYVSNVCTIFLPLVPILFFQILTASTWSTSQESGALETRRAFRPDAPASNRRAPIMIFVFDEWSYKRTSIDGKFLPEYPNSARIAADSMAFTQAWSYATRSYYSVPAIIFQNDQNLQIGPGLTRLSDHGKSVPSADVPSLFAEARRAGYHTALQGFYLPYQRILGDQIEYARSWPTEPRGNTFLESMGVSAVRNLFRIVEPFTSDARQALQARIQSQYWFTRNHQMIDESLRLIDECPPNTFAIFHWPLPHGPFVLNEDGSYNGPYPSGNLIDGLHGPHAQLEDYQRHLKLHDNVLGQIVAHLKASGKYDDALLIFTSDHSWRPDPMERYTNWVVDPSRRQVPLLIKMPGQRAPRIITKTIYNNLHLRPIVEAVLREGALSEDAALALIDRTEDVPTPTGPYSTRPHIDEGGAATSARVNTK